MDALALDAMGVLYSVGDDVADLLVPFVRQAGGLRILPPSKPPIFGPAWDH